MNKALSTSEANKYLIELGYDQYHPNYIEDNDFTLQFGKVDYYISETDNMFDEKHEFRWWDFIGTRFSLNFSVNSHNKKNYLGIFRHITDSDIRNNKSDCIIRYTELSASDKKKFIEIFEKLSKKKKILKLDKEICDQIHPYWGKAKPKKIVELK